jgi:S1-C subfamily serine protease
VNIIITKELTVYKNDPFNFFRQPVWSIERKIWWGTGFFVSKDGIILTNKHVVQDPNAQYTVILNNWDEYPAQILAKDPITDLAAIKIDTDKEIIPLEFIENYEGENSQIQIWQFAIATGNALAEFQNSVSLWVISWTNRTIEAENEKLSGLLQTDAAINPWNSGGPLVNLDGKVMWINTAISGNAQWIGFSIPLSKTRVDFILESIEKYWEIKKPFIWINYFLLNSDTAMSMWLSVDYWAYIPPQNPDSILKNSSADKAGLKLGDIILEVDWIKISESNDLISFIQNKTPRQKINLTVLHENGVTENIPLYLGIQE